MSEVFFLENLFLKYIKKQIWIFVIKNHFFFFFYITKQIWIFVITKPFLHPTKQIWYFDKSKSFFLTIKTYLIFFNKNNRFHPYINLCDLTFHSHVQHIMHDMHSIVHWSQESRRPNFVWAEWVPNTVPFRNLVSGFRFLV